MNAELAVASASGFKSLSLVYHEKGIVGAAKDFVDSDLVNSVSGIGLRTSRRHDFLGVAWYVLVTNIVADDPTLHVVV